MTKSKATTETISIGFGEAEAEYVRAKADAAKLSTSKWIKALVARYVDPSEDATVAGYLDDFKAPEQAPGPRTHRVSSVIRAADADVLRVAARRQGVTPHAWLQAVVYVGSLRQRVETPLTTRPAAQAHIDHGERALELLASTLSAMIARPDKAPYLAETMRHRANVEPGAPLSAATIAAMAKAATAPKAVDRTNVVELRPAPVPEYRRDAMMIVDRAGNRARLSTFDTEDACKAALASCKGCEGCVDCVDCVDCEDCTSCGQCRECIECHRCIAQVGERGEHDKTVATRSH